MQKQYAITLKTTVDEEEMKANGWDIQEIVYDSLEDAPIYFDIEDCREISD